MKLKIAIPALFSFVLVTGCASTCKDCSCEVSEAVAVADLPQPVKATLDKEAAGGKVVEVEREQLDGKTVYSADVEVAGKLWDITIASDGAVLSRKEEMD